MRMINVNEKFIERQDRQLDAIAECIQKGYEFGRHPALQFLVDYDRSDYDMSKKIITDMQYY